jgi:Nitrogen permease regulator 2
LDNAYLAILVLIASNFAVSSHPGSL